ncbi:MAG: hypothetical protein JWM11_3640 [Planctomycetaceae bacterium]|nr:hypothetical protein [Planctomycetaceae bacterium]
MWYWDGTALNQDIDAYLEIARHLARGEGFSRGDPPEATAYRPPLYPLMVAGLFSIGGGPWLLGALQVVLGTLTTALTLRCGQLLDLGWGRFIAAGFVAFDPLLIRYTTLPMTETLCAMLVVLWCWAVLEFPWTRNSSLEIQSDSQPQALIHGFLHGACFGLICLCRPAFLGALGLAAICCIAMPKLRWRCSACTTSRPIQPAPSAWSAVASLAGLAIVLSPWVVRNAVVIGKPTPATTHGGYTVLLANNPTFYREVLRGTPGAVWEEKSLLAWQQALEQDLKQDGISPSNEVARDAWMYRRARANILAEPISFLQACSYRSGCFWALAPSRAANGLGTFESWCITLFYGLVSVGLVLGVLSMTGTEWDRWRPLLLLPVTLWLTHLVYWTDTRMRTPVVPVLALLAARGFVAPRSHPFQSRFRRALK